MPTLIEKQASWSTGKLSETRIYHVNITAADSPTWLPAPSDAKAYFESVAPTISGYSLDDVSAEEISTIGDGSSVTEGRFEVTAVWNLPEAADFSFPEGTIRTSSRTAVQTVKIRQSRSTTSAAAASWFNGGTAEDYGGLINVDEEGNVEGVDVQVPATIYTATKKVLTSTVNDTYEIAAHSVVGHTNSQIYRSRAVGTLLCVGVSIAQVDSSHSEVAAEFAFAPNETGISAGDITGIAKKAWEYLWVRVAKRKVAGRVLPEIGQANVEVVYPSADFAIELGF